MEDESTSARASFVARFGEDQAVAVERAGQGHLSDPFGGARTDDNHGSDEFRYWFLAAIGYECVTRPSFREQHGITVDVAEMQDWAKWEGRLGEHDGDPPDFLSLLTGAYTDWLPGADEARWTPEMASDAES